MVCGNYFFRLYVLLSSAVSAADTSYPPVQLFALGVLPTFVWTGAYIGGQVVVAHHQTDNRVQAGFSDKFEALALPGPIWRGTNLPVQTSLRRHDRA
jgi:hypothetical protein